MTVLKINTSNISKLKQIQTETTQKTEKPKQEYEQKDLASSDVAKSMRAYVIPAKQLSFGKRIEEHRSWGATVKETSQDGSQAVDFKVWAPKAAKVLVEVRNPQDKVALTDEQFKAEHLKDKWAGDWHIDAFSDDGKSTFVELKKGKDGIFTGESKLPYSNGMYRYVLEDANGNTISKTKDPVAKAQPHIFSWSQIYDNNQYQ